MTVTNEYQPGDIVNGHVLGGDNQWHPVGYAPTGMPEEEPKKNSNKKWIVLGAAGAALLGLIVIGAASGEASDSTADAGTSTPAVDVIDAVDEVADVDALAEWVDWIDSAGEPSNDTFRALAEEGMAAAENADFDGIVDVNYELSALFGSIPDSPSAELNAIHAELSDVYADIAYYFSIGDYDSATDRMEDAVYLTGQRSAVLEAVLADFS